MEKIILLIIATTFIFSNAFTQLNKKTWMIGGSGSFSKINSYDNSNNKTSNAIYANLSSNIGYFVIDKLATGIKLGYSYQKSDYTGNPNSNSISQYEIGPFIRYYFLMKEKDVNIFTEINYLHSIEKENNSGSSTNSNTFGIKAGPSIFLNSIVGLEFTVGYSNVKYHPANSKLIFLQFGIGLQIHLENNKN